MLNQTESSQFDNSLTLFDNSKTLYFGIDLPNHITVMLSAKYNMTMIYNVPADNSQKKTSSKGDEEENGKTNNE